ncbi:RDD family protein [Isoptericola sp. NEAU-Y5]|uniref:RDD family protein n=1 Tax=Isoptericola luteus TaxID=2879484 RepID=A0ABS7ZJ55_9MICO|nr:RDD family protein [Isoptericola sp. NEAU-Y5]MCA5895064.1 RDD family protein [Isoptericola sp. NEAU-Y5]
MTTTCGACGAAEQSGAFCTVCGTPTGVGPQPGLSAGQEATEPEMREATRRGATLAPPAAAPATEPPLAGVGRRAGAYLLDVLAVSIVSGVVAGILAVVTGVGEAMSALAEATTVMGATAASNELAGALAVVYGVAGLVSLAGWVLLALLDGLTGATLGNRLLGIRTVALDGGGPVGAGRGLLRWLVLAGAGVLPLLGTVLVLVSPTFDATGRRQGWHDKAGRSVVRDVRGVPPRTFAPASAGPGVAAAASAGAARAGAPVPDPWAFPEAARDQGGLVTGVPGSSAAGTPPAQPDPQGAGHGGPAGAAGPGLYDADPHTVHRAPVRADGAGTAAPATPATPAQPPAQRPVAQQPFLQQPAAPRPVAPAPAAPPHAVAPAADAEDLEDLEATRFSVSSRRSSGDGTMPPRIVVEIDPGRRVTVASRTLVGRNPQQDGAAPATLLSVPDATRSVSKTHLELVPTPEGLQARDLGSTNGSAVIAPDGTVHELVAGIPVTVTAGWVVQAGARRITVVGAGGA